jgi:hypothetical protein
MATTSNSSSLSQLAVLRNDWSALDCVIIAGLLGIVAAFTLAQLLEPAWYSFPWRREWLA